MVKNRAANPRAFVMRAFKGNNIPNHKTMETSQRRLELIMFATLSSISSFISNILTNKRVC